MSARGRTWVFGMSAGWKDPGRLARAGVELLTVPWDRYQEAGTMGADYSAKTAAAAVDAGSK